MSNRVKVEPRAKKKRRYAITHLLCDDPAAHLPHLWGTPGMFGQYVFCDGVSVRVSDETRQQ